MPRRLVRIKHKAHAGSAPAGASGGSDDPGARVAAVDEVPQRAQERTGDSPVTETTPSSPPRSRSGGATPPVSVPPDPAAVKCDPVGSASGQNRRDLHPAVHGGGGLGGGRFGERLFWRAGEPAASMRRHPSGEGPEYTVSLESEI